MKEESLDEALKRAEREHPGVAEFRKKFELVPGSADAYVQQIMLLMGHFGPPAQVDLCAEGLLKAPDATVEQIRWAAASKVHHALAIQTVIDRGTEDDLAWAVEHEKGAPSVKEAASKLMHEATQARNFLGIIKYLPELREEAMRKFFASSPDEKTLAEATQAAVDAKLPDFLLRAAEAYVALPSPDPKHLAMLMHWTPSLRQKIWDRRDLFGERAISRILPDTFDVQPPVLEYIWKRHHRSVSVLFDLVRTDGPYAAKAEEALMSFTPGHRDYQYAMSTVLTYGSTHKIAAARNIIAHATIGTNVWCVINSEHTSVELKEQAGRKILELEQGSPDFERTREAVFEVLPGLRS